MSKVREVEKKILIDLFLITSLLVKYHSENSFHKVFGTKTLNIGNILKLRGIERILASKL